MKKILLLLLFIPLVSFGQEDEKEIENNEKNDVIFGVKAGLNLSTMSNGLWKSGGFDFNNRTSFHLGLTAEINFNEKFSIQPELLYSGQGFKFPNSMTTIYPDGSTIDSSNSITVIQNYLNLPVIAKFYISNTFFLETGPQIGYLISANAKFGDGTNIEYAKSDMEDFDFGFNIGAGYRLNSGTNFNLRYYLGLGSHNFYALNDKNYVLSFSVGFRL